MYTSDLVRRNPLIRFHYDALSLTFVTVENITDPLLNVNTA